MNRIPFRAGGSLALACVAIVLFAARPSRAQSLLPADVRESIDKIASQTLERTGVPSASVAVVKDGQIVYEQAYGDARLDPRVAANTRMRYSVGSISKQFTATAILMLAEEGKLSLDDPVGRFLPNLTRANEVTIRQILSHTSGYQDYWPQDYVPPFMLQPITAEKILDLWARKPLDFEPGTKWQYSNTNYVIAGLILEKASGTPLLEFLGRRIFTPLKMTTVVNIDQTKLGDSDPTGYMRYALGPLRPAPKEGKGWLFAAGELAMTADDLAKWDIAMINQSLLKPASYKEMQTEVKLKNGDGTRYGLGIDVFTQDGHRVIEHGGEVSGFTSDNLVLPDDRVAVAVLTNQDAVSAASTISQRVGSLFIPASGAQGVAAQKLAQVRAIYEGLQRGQIDRSLFTEDANAYFTDQALKDFASGLGTLGAPDSFTATGSGLRGGMTLLTYRVTYPQRNLGIVIFMTPDGKYEQYQIMPRN
ncbi:MAG: beta-lactamase family protein [Acidobacteriota bacterium]|nr:beta-lactamase family protein [Acidobacteriota bacterium]